MKTCRTCGRQVGSWKFCKYCGTKLDERDLSFQKTNTLLRQNIILSDNIGNNESDSDFSRRVPVQNVDTQQTVDTISLQDAKVADDDTRTTCEEPIPDESPMFEVGTNNNISSGFTLDKTDAFTDVSATQYPFEEENDTANQESLSLNSSIEDEAPETIVHDDAVLPNDECLSVNQSIVTNQTEEPMVTEIDDAEPGLPDESSAVVTENNANNSSVQIIEEAAQLNDGSKAEPYDNNDTESPLNLGSLFNFTNLQGKDSEPDSESTVREIMPNYTQDEMIETVDENPVVEVESFDEIGVSTNDEGEMNDDIPIKDTNYLKEEMDGFSKVDFESVDTTADVFETFNVDTVKSYAVVEEPNTSFDEEPSVVESDYVSLTQDSHEAEQTPQSFEKITSAEKPQISVSDIDPMFGSAPTFDIDSIKASFQPVASSDKKKSKKGFFNRKKK